VSKSKQETNMTRKLIAASLLALVAASAHANGDSQLIVIKDPQTGQLRGATAEEMAARAPVASSASVRRPLPTLRSNSRGFDTVRASDDMQNFTVARRNADGTIVMTCVHGKTAAEAQATGHSHAEPAVSTGLPTQ
jgi:hypothetical protein